MTGIQSFRPCANWLLCAGHHIRCLFAQTPPPPLQARCLTLAMPPACRTAPNELTQRVDANTHALCTADSMHSVLPLFKSLRRTTTPPRVSCNNSLSGRQP
eukprot:365662-Chlamydomonas_euryale.AAC.8